MPKNIERLTMQNVWGAFKSNNIAFQKHRRVPTYPIHWQDYYEIEFFLDGSAEEEVNGITTKMKQGSIILMAPDCLHGVSSNQVINTCNIMFSESALDESLLKQIHSGKLKTFLSGDLSEKDYEYVKMLIERLQYETEQKQDFHIEHIRSILNIIVSLILRTANVKPNYDDVKENVIKAMNYVRDNYENNPSCSEVAEYLKMSPSYFSVYFKENAGISYNTFLNDVKLASAAKKLSLTQMSLIDICYSSGFESLSNFHRRFKEKYSYTPIEYRNASKMNK